MPFAEMIPHPLTSGGIGTYAPAQPGVYGLSNSREWIFIGEADDIRSALLTHLTDAPAKSVPTGFVFEICDPSTRMRRMERLILEYEPVNNRYFGWKKSGRS